MKRFIWSPGLLVFVTKLCLRFFSQVDFDPYRCQNEKLPMSGCNP